MARELAGDTILRRQEELAKLRRTIAAMYRRMEAAKTDETFHRLNRERAELETRELTLEREITTLFGR